MALIATRRSPGVFSPDAVHRPGPDLRHRQHRHRRERPASPSTLFGLRRGDVLPDRRSTSHAQYAIYQDTATAARGMRLTVAADGNIFITGHLNYRVEPRGADGIFSEPIPGDATGTSADDQLDVQNVLGIVSWGLGGWPAGVRLSSALTGDLATHAMVFVANLNGKAEPSGQFSFDDPNGTYRGDLARPGRRRPEDHGDLRVSRGRTPGTRGTGCTTSASGTVRCRRRPSPASRTSPRRRRSASTATAGASGIFQ